MSPAEHTPGVTWRWGFALRGLITAAPAAIASLSDPVLAAGLAVGLIPVCSLPLPPRRGARLRMATFGIVAAAAVLAGGVLAQWPPLAVAALVVAGGLVGHAQAARPTRLTMLGMVIWLPLMAVGFSYPGASSVADLAVDILLGTVWSVLVALAWPTRPPVEPAVAPPAAPRPPARLTIIYGWTAGATGATCAAIGFLADLEHVGWAPAAALLVMRPSMPVQKMRSWDRIADVLLGATAAAALVTLGPPDWVYACVIGIVVMAATATAGSRWYVLPTFTTFLVFILLLADDPAQAGHRFWERLLETLVGVGAAALATWVVLPLLTRSGAGSPTENGSERSRQHLRRGGSPR